MWKTFSQILLEILESVASLKGMRPKQRVEPSFIGNIIRMISGRNKAW